MIKKSGCFRHLGRNLSGTFRRSLLTVAVELTKVDIRRIERLNPVGSFLGLCLHKVLQIFADVGVQFGTSSASMEAGCLNWGISAVSLSPDAKMRYANLGTTAVGDLGDGRLKALEYVGTIKEQNIWRS